MVQDIFHVDISKKISRVCMVAYAHYFTDARIKAYANSLLRQGVSVDILCLKEPGKRSSREVRGRLAIFHLSSKYAGSSNVNYIISYIRFFLLLLGRLSFLHLRRHYNVVHVHNMPNFIIFAAVVPRILGAKLILDMHDIFSITFFDKFKTRGSMKRILEIEESWSVRFADRVICADDFQKKFLERRRKIPPERIRVIMNLPDNRIFLIGEGPLRERREYLNVVYHGTVTSRLGVDIILHAIARLKDSIKIRFFLYGTGDFFDECLKIVKESGLQDTVYLSGKFFSVEELPALLSDKNLGVIGNRRTKATNYMLPVKMLEYMAMGIPVIAPRLENIEYYVSDKEVCFYEPENVSDLAEKILYLYENPGVMDTLSKNASEFIARHNWHDEEIKYLHLLKTL